MYRFSGLLFFFTLSLSSYSQVKFSGEANLQGQYATTDKLPFWMYHNKRGRISETTNLAVWVAGRMNLDVGFYSKLELGAGLLYQDGIKDEIFLDEVYAHFQSPEFFITAGRKQQEELYQGLSASNKNMLWSLNARPLPGLQFGTSGILFLNDYEQTGFGFQGSWNEYLAGQERYISYTRIHHKNLFLVYRSESGLQIKAGGSHFAQWGGTRPSGDQRPETADDYLRIISGMGGGVSNYLGVAEFHLSKDFRDYCLKFLYNYIFESFTGLALSNIPDGRYGLFFETTEKDKIINSVLYEFYYTQNQNYNTGSFHEDYLNSGVYRSGWTYENRMLAVPFFRPSQDGEGVVNNRFTAHHIGIGGQFSNWFVYYPYKLLLSFSRNSGTYAVPLEYEMFAAYYEFGLFRTKVDLDLQFGAEFNSNAAPIFGAGLHLKKRF